MTTEIIEGEAHEVTPEPIRAVVVAQPGQAIVASDAPDGPEKMLERATAIATALARMVEKQKLYTVIRDRKYPHVEAWQTIGRMDNVVARESMPPVRHDDGSYEAFVELLRLSDGMVIGNASALCGTEDDTAGRQNWSKASEPSRRSMAVTRATSRAFRQQYAWIMALAGYEPTPADEMPQGDAAQPDRTEEDGLIGIATIGKPGAGTDFELRQEAEQGWVIGFRLGDGGKGFAVYAFGAMAEALVTLRSEVIDQRVTCWGKWAKQSFKKGRETITYNVLHLERIHTAETILPAVSVAPEPSGEPVAPGQETLALDAEERAAVAAGLPDAAA